MATIRFEPLEAPVLDPRNEKQLVELALDRIYTASGGKINDFSSHSPARALTEGLCFAGAEILYYANLLPEAIAVNFLQIVGIQRRMGTASQAIVRYELIESLDSAFIVAAGSIILSASGKLMFVTNRQLIINPGATTGDVDVTCTEVGSKGNVAAGVISKTPQKLAYLKRIWNPNAASGGTDAESIEETKARGFQAIRRRGLISKADYEEETTSLLGTGAIALALGNVGADGETQADGNIHVFALNADGSLLNPAQILSLRTQLRQKSLLTVANFVWVSSITYAPLHIEVVAKLQSGANPVAVAEEIWNKLQDYLKPGRYPIGETIILKELEYQARLAGGTEFLHSLSLAAEYYTAFYPVNFPMPVAHATPELRSVTVLLQGDERDYRYLKGHPDYY
ncbi:MAG TPA: baseplate J/gp47 family protein [Vampirovibrionales bacterium]